MLLNLLLLLMLLLVMNLRPQPPPLVPMESLPTELMRRIAVGYASDPYFANEKNVLRFAKAGNVWKWQGLVVVPHDPALRTEILALCHEPPFSGHPGVDKTLQLVLRNFWWPSLGKDVKLFVQACTLCQKNKASNQLPAGLLQPLAIPTRRWQSVSVDLITHLPLTRDGHTAIVVFVDRLSKMVHFAPAWTDVSAVDMAYIFVQNVFRLHGLPNDIVSDRDPRFTSHFWHEVCSLLGIKQSMSTSFHPQSDGQTERANRTLEDMLRHYVSPSQDDWDRKLAMCEFAVNNAWNSSTGESAFFLNSGEHPVTPLTMKGEPVSSNLPAVTQFLENTNKALQRAHENLEQAQARMKRVKDAKRRDLQFQVGQYVWLSTKHIPLAHAGTRKFENKWIGPFRVVKAVGAVAYELDLPPSMRIHDVFHVSLLKPHFAGGKDEAPPPAVLVDGSVEYEVESIIASRSRKGKLHYLVKWLGLGPEENEWLPENALLHCQDAVQRFLNYSLTAARAAQVRRATRLEAQNKLAVQRAGERASVVKNATAGILPEDAVMPAPKQIPRRRRGRPSLKLLLCL